MITRETVKSTLATSILEIGSINFGKYIFLIRFCLLVIELDTVFTIWEKKFQANMPVKAKI